MSSAGPIFAIPVYEDSGCDSDDQDHHLESSFDTMYDDDDDNDDATTLNHAPHVAQIPSQYTTQTMTPPGYPFFSYTHDYMPAPDSSDDEDNDGDGDVDMSDSDGGAPLGYGGGPLTFTTHDYQGPPPWPTSSMLNMPQTPYHPHSAIPPSYDQTNPANNTVPIPVPPFSSPSNSHTIPETTNSSLISPHLPFVAAIPPQPFTPPQFSSYNNIPPSNYPYNPAPPPPPNDDLDTAFQAPIPFPTHQPHMVTQLDEDAEELEGPHPPPVTSFHTNSGFQGPQTPGILGPQNPGLVPFLRKWAHPGLSLSNDTRPRFRSPWLPTVNELENLRVKRVDYDDLMGDQCDVQGIDWTQLGVTRREARERRLNTYTNFVNVDGSDAFNVCVTALISLMSSSTPTYIFCTRC